MNKCFNFQDVSCSHVSVELVQSLSIVLDPLLRGGSKFGEFFFLKKIDLELSLTYKLC